MPKTEENLRQKLVGIAQEIRDVPKSGYNAFQKYEYVTHDDVMATIGTALAKAGILAFPSVTSVEMIPNKSEKGGDVTRVHFDFTFMDTESDEKIVVKWIGDGQDRSDKGIYKAYTGGVKTLLLKFFNVAAGGEDPEDERDGRENGREEKRGKEQPRSKEQPKEKAKYKAIIVDGAVELDSVKHNLVLKAEEYGDGDEDAIAPPYTQLVHQLFGVDYEEDALKDICDAMFEWAFGSTKCTYGRMKAFIWLFVAMEDGKPLKEEGDFVLAEHAEQVAEALLNEVEE